jgi:hypothetical protein
MFPATHVNYIATCNLDIRRVSAISVSSRMDRDYTPILVRLHGGVYIIGLGTKPLHCSSRQTIAGCLQVLKINFPGLSITIIETNSMTFNDVNDH